MDGSDIYKAANSIRLGSLRVGSSSRASSLRNGSTSVWRNSGMDAFSKSVREEDDEEALKWASLEKLPTFDRLKKGLLFGSTGPSNEVDVDNLGPDDRRRILDRLVKTADEDNEGFLLKLRNRLDRVGIELPTIEVKYEHVTVEADVNTGSRALPSFINFHIELVEVLLGLFHLLPNSKRHITILDDVSGVVKPKRMTLLLGPPSSGKTSLLLAMAGTLAKELKCSGKVTYNGHELHEFVPERTSAYISQNDVHIGEMTVRETLAFSARCQGVGSRYDMLAELSRRERDANIKPDPDLDIFMKAAATEGQEANVVTDYTLKLLGLDICADTMVGDQMIRGISGGQRKRVTTGEMIVGPSKVLLMDEISTGLDSSTTFQIVKSLKQFIHILEGTAVISLLQPAPETYDLFDDIVLLTDGKIVYQGPREHVLEFFESVGFKCPERKGVADFLQEVTSKKDQQQYWMRRDMPYRFVTAKEFAEAYQSFHVGRKLATDLATPYDKSKSHPAALTTEKYGLNKKELLKACTDREILLMKRNSFVYFFKLFQLIVMAFISMTVFFRTEMHKRTLTDGGFYNGAAFFGVTLLMFNGMSEISMTIAKLPVFYKQRNFLFYPSWAYAIPSWIMKIPVSFVEAAVWTILTYYVMGFDPNVTRFFKYFFILMLVNQMSSGLFRFIGALGRNMIVANTFGSFGLLLVFALGGFILSRDDIKGWWIWGYWASPMIENVLAYNKLVAELEEMVTRMVFETYGVEKYLDAHRKMVTYLCRGMKYRPPVENETNMGFVPHTDKDFITVLHQNGVNGLEVKARDGEWFSVELVPSSYIVMSGDAAMAWSNERLYSPFHRVTMNGKESRYSIAQFSFLEGIIETPKEFVDEEHPLLYKPFDHLKYLDFYNKEENRRLECAIRTYCGV
ncbi:pleiotropic drug resistance protein 1 [Artemisia annua]|uniref:Pleiotropic drug resistance protein 1 n=1 Tax=Artemisia annua TaxID=35608 RepID=A0A2U1NIE3_ARTAN|nr:pleiotropic drug resistance protein 1 [Artemisia annua]